MPKKIIDIVNDKTLDILIESEYRLITKLQDERKRLERDINEFCDFQEIRETHDLIQNHRNTRDILHREIQKRKGYQTIIKIERK